MGEVNYKPLIDDMVWSFSRVEAYESCPHRWYLRYIRRCKERDKFYSSYGSFMHKIIERYYNGEITKAEMLTTFLRDFKKEVRGFRPKASTLQKFIDGAVEYLKNFEPFPYKMVAVADFVGEKKSSQIHVEEIQDIVERRLMASNRKDVAKEYIIYRDKRSNARERNSKLNREIAEKLQAINISNQNANVDEKSFGGRIGSASGAVLKKYALDYCVSDMARNNHLNNEIYIHDLAQ